jgi:uncharacterized membrane protein
MTQVSLTYKPLIKAGTVLGIGLGGFIDGIVFHQLLQTHNMLSARLPKTTIPNLEVNMFWDGLFHLFCHFMVVVGLILLWRAGSRSDVPWAGKTLVGAMLMGWGFFNLVEGLIDHHLLHTHHVVEALGVSVYDYAFLLSGVVLMVAGWLTVRRERNLNIVLHPLPPPAGGS